MVGLEIKREFTVGRLASRRAAALPIAAALGGMVVPALIYLAARSRAGRWAHGWGVPIATDTAFAVALIVMLGERVPVELRIFLTAAAIVDDLVAIVVVALFYSGDARPRLPRGAAVRHRRCCALLNRGGVYRAAALRAARRRAVGLRARRRPARDARRRDARAGHADPAAGQPARADGAGRDAIIDAEMRGAATRCCATARRSRRCARSTRSTTGIESPADPAAAHVEPWSSYFVLPLFALANAGVALSHRRVRRPRAADARRSSPAWWSASRSASSSAPALAVRLGIAVKPDGYSWRQLAGAGALAGIGFTMSLFIAGQAFPSADDFAAAKIAVFVASIVSAIIGVLLLWKPFASADAPSPDAADTLYKHTEVGGEPGRVAVHP